MDCSKLNSASQKQFTSYAQLDGIGAYLTLYFHSDTDVRLCHFDACEVATAYRCDTKEGRVEVYFTDDPNETLIKGFYNSHADVLIMQEIGIYKNLFWLRR